MTISDIAAGTGVAAALAGGVGAAVRHVLRSFHAEHVQPALTDISHAIKANTLATSALTERMGQSDETCTAMGKILADHETRITVIEAKPPRRRSA